MATKTSNHWKTTAIIFITLFILETLLIIYSYNLGTSMVQNEQKCSILCANRDAESYNYDASTTLCNCNVDGEVDYQEFIS